MLTDGQALAQVTDARQRKLGWVMVKAGYGDAIRDVIKKGFDDLERRMVRLSVAFDEDLLDLIEGLEHRTIESIISIAQCWDIKEIKARNSPPGEVITVDMAVDEALEYFKGLMGVFHTHVVDHRLVDQNNATQMRVMLHLELLEEHVNTYLPILIRTWK